MVAAAADAKGPGKAQIKRLVERAFAAQIEDFRGIVNDLRRG